MAYYKFTRKIVQEQDVFVEAPSPEIATEKYESLDWVGESEFEHIRAYATPKPKRLKGIPVWLWDELGHPQDVNIAS